MVSINNDFADAKEEFLRVQAQITNLIATREVKEVEGAIIESRIAMVSSTVDCFGEDFIMPGDQVRFSLATEEDLCKCILSAFPK